MSRKEGPLSNPATQDRLRRHERLREQIRRMDMQAVMGTQAGRRFVWQVLAGRCGTFGASFTGEALTGAFNEGRRAVGLELMAALQEVCPEAYLAMLGEASSAQTEDVHTRKEALETPEEADGE